MPSSTPRQARFMAACAHGAGYASCPPQKVSEEFNQADAVTGILKKHNTTARLTKKGRPAEAKRPFGY